MIEEAWVWEEDDRPSSVISQEIKDNVYKGENGLELTLLTACEDKTLQIKAKGDIYYSLRHADTHKLALVRCRGVRRSGLAVRLKEHMN